MGIYKYLYVYWLYIIANLFFFFGKIRIFAVLNNLQGRQTPVTSIIGVIFFANTYQVVS